MTLLARAMTAADLPVCVEILNAIIATGGTTAHEDPLTLDAFRDHYFDDPKVVNVVTDGNRIVGFQACYEGEGGLFYIGSFTDQTNPVKGAGRVMFAKTRADCAALGGTAIIAKITADNGPGLGYYAAMGFADDHTLPRDHQRRTGAWVDRVVKRLEL